MFLLTATMPYSVSKLLARHKSRQTYDDAPKTASQKLFDQELKAEAQARVEITEYIDQLVDHAEYEEAYVCVWRLEEYRREGWAKEMVAAHPHESCGFIRDLNRRQSRARRP